MHNAGYESALARRACRYSDAQPSRKTDGVLLESEIPPRMRGKVKRQQATAPPGQDHPRVCGEKFRAYAMIWQEWGSPPRMRGKGRFESPRCRAVGITPAYAGKSTGYNPGHCRPTDHPRVCGEKMSTDGQRVPISGLPPRMRGKVPMLRRFPIIQGITPAYAGKRRHERMGRQNGQDHPRVCGEKLGFARELIPSLGSPPRMRGKDGTKEWADKMGRITPAYAGKSLVSLGSLSQVWDHPRVCGEKFRC